MTASNPLVAALLSAVGTPPSVVPHEGMEQLAVWREQLQAVQQDPRYAELNRRRPAMSQEEYCTELGKLVSELFPTT